MLVGVVVVIFKTGGLMLPLMLAVNFEVGGLMLPLVLAMNFEVGMGYVC